MVISKTQVRLPEPLAGERSGENGQARPRATARESWRPSFLTLS